MMSLREVKDIPYYHRDDSDDGPIDPLRTLDLYYLDDSDAGAKIARSPSESILVVFVHGGAWRAGDKSRHTSLAQRWALSQPASPKVVVAVPNYRLSPKIKHPVHTRDIHDAVRFLLDSQSGSPGSERIGRGSPIPLFQYSAVWIVGHSAGAHIAASLVLGSAGTTPSLHPITPSTPSVPDSASSTTPSESSILQRITGIIGIEGIYDIDTLLDSFPSDFYREFVEQAFGARSSSIREPRPYDDVNATLYILPQSRSRDADHLRWVIVHSKDDELVDSPQAERMVAHLRELYDGLAAADVGTDAGSEDEDVPEKGKRRQSVVAEYNRVSGRHDELLESEELAQFVGDVIMGRL